MNAPWLTAIPPAVIVILVLLELRDDHLRAGLRQRPRLLRNLSYLGASLVVMSLLPLWSDLIHRAVIPMFSWPGYWGWELLACTLVAEFLGWLLHYVKHRNQFLWSFHFQHHREENFNAWLTTHTHALEVAVSATLIGLTTSLLGFSTFAVQAYVALYSIAKVYQHSVHNYSLGPLDWLLVSPRYHRLHHRADLRCNYAITITFFDLLFRTARWPVPSDAKGSQYGVEEGRSLPYGYWAEMTFFLKKVSPRDHAKEGGRPLHRRA